MLIELGLVEQRHKAVLEVLAGATVTDVATRYGVTRQSVHRWLRLYGASGLSGLVDRSSRPGSCPHQMPPEVEARVLEMRRTHPLWGPRTIRYHLSQEGTEPLPGRSSVYRALVRHGLIDPQKRRRKRADYRRWERSRPMELWQMDVMGGVQLTSGAELKVITGIDDHSRFCVCARLVERATARPVCEALASAMRTYGVPEQILTDNGKVFTGRFGPGTGEVLFDRICRENGVRHLLTAPHSPTTTGKVERFHKTLRSEFLAGRSFTSLAEAQGQLEAYLRTYNTERPHQGIGMVPPVKRFAWASEEPPEVVLPGPEEEREVKARGEADARHIIRCVSANGKISLATFSYHVGRFLAGETVEVQIDDRLVQVYRGGTLVATHARRHPLDAEPTSWQTGPRPTRAQVPTSGTAVMRKVDAHGDISFAGSGYRAGNKFIGEQVEVALRGDTVQISSEGRIIRTHQARHDPSKEHGAFANPGGRPHRKKAS